MTSVTIVLASERSTTTILQLLPCLARDENNQTIYYWLDIFSYYAP